MGLTCFRVSVLCALLIAAAGCNTISTQTPVAIEKSADLVEIVRKVGLDALARQLGDFERIKKVVDAMKTEADALTLNNDTTNQKRLKKIRAGITNLSRISSRSDPERQQVPKLKETLQVVEETLRARIRTIERQRGKV